MSNTNLLTVRQIAGILSEKPERVNYVVAKDNIGPTSRIGNIRLFTWRQVTSIRKSLEGITKCAGN
ncbi:MAG: hypothetical protein HQ580_14675 [Planctomycetes bacterium]|nr:hypothetical protein [Planctomycetota bacterium]